MDIIDAVIGLDFGTATTKVVVQTPYYNNKMSVPVSFDAINPAHSYLLPSQIYVNPDGQVSLTNLADFTVETNLKYRLIKSKRKTEDLLNSRDGVLTVLFLSSVIAYTKNWYIKNYKNKYFPNSQIRWAINIGIPSNGYDDENQVIFYRTITWIAYRISNYIDSLNVDKLKNHILSLTKDLPNYINVVPEVISEAIGYARSSERNPGLHFIMDIGASTLDFTGFILEENQGDDLYPILYADVQLLGALELHRVRQKKIFLKLLGWYDEQMNSYESYKAIPNSIDGYFPDNDYINSHFLEDFQKEFSNRCRTSLNKMICEVRKRRDPHSDRWKELLPIFVCGGGSHLDFYHDIIKQSEFNLKDTIKGFKGYNKKTLNKPDNLIVSGDIDYNRLAVAYGLSTPYDDIGEIKPQYRIRDIETKYSQKYDYDNTPYNKDQV
ncbi:MAG: hypothetical protein ACFFFT_05015 [Candidatus Thorarchaeota archaeon]